MASSLFIGPATKNDGVDIRELVASVLAEFGLPNNRSITDDDLFDIEASYDAHGTHLWVLVDEGTIIGTTALLQVSGSTCVLRKCTFGRQLEAAALAHCWLSSAFAKLGSEGSDASGWKPQNASPARYDFTSVAGFDR